jgi:hypothetical protein
MRAFRPLIGGLAVPPWRLVLELPPLAAVAVAAAVAAADP